jgi:hypothetical protein
LFEQVGSELEELDLAGLKSWTYHGYPLGALCLPGIQWALRRYELPSDPEILGLYRQYLRSAAGLVERFEALFEEQQPRSLVVFNGITYPEAVARAVAERMGISTVTHEVGLKPQSAYFSHQEATFREVPLEAEYQLNQRQQAELDLYLADRRRGKFSMAGVEFWPEIQAMPAAISQKLEQFSKMVPIFSNVIFDTSQVHANALFRDMFEWLDYLVGVIKANPDVLFIIRAHPDENRPGKEAAQSVSAWFEMTSLAAADNVLFFSPDEFVSSYQLIDAAHVVLVYNSSIGLEASIMGALVLAAGKARYTQSEAVKFPGSRLEYQHLLSQYLQSDQPAAPAEHARNARRFLYRELHEASLDFSEYLRPYPSMPGMVFFESFKPRRLRADKTLDVLCDGVLEQGPFLEPSTAGGVGGPD